MKKTALLFFRLLAPLLIAQQVALPLQAYAQTSRIIVNKEDMDLRKEMDTRVRDNAAGARRVAPPAAAPDLSYGTPPAGWAGQRAPTAAEQSLDAQRAAEAANRFFPADKATTLHDAQRSNEVARSAFSTSGVRNYSDTSPVQSGRNSSQQGLSFYELFPGFSSREGQRMVDSYGHTYEDQGALKDTAEYNAKNRLLRNGCQRTEFELIEKLNQSAAFDDRAHRILSVTFLDYVKTDIIPPVGATESCIRNGQPSTCPAKAKEQYDVTNSTYKGGPLKLSVALMGSGGNTWNDFIGSSQVIAYDYNPYTFNEKLNYFPFNVKVLYKIGGVVQEAPNAVVNIGTPSDRWTPVIAWTPPVGTQQIVVVADVYKAVHQFDDPQLTGGICPPIPPVSCAKAADNGQTISWCAGTATANIVTMFSSTAQPDLSMKGRDEMMPMYGNLARNEGFLQDNSLKMGALTGINASAGAAAASLSGACYRVPASQVQSYMDRKGQEVIETCSRRVISAFEPNGVTDLKRQFGVSQLAQHQFLQVRGWNKVKVAIPLTNPVQYTFQLQAANVTGAVDINQFPVMGAAQCNAECKANPGRCNQQTCTLLPPADEEGYYLEYVHTPFVESPSQYGVSAITPNGGTASITHFGRPSDSWRPVGSATAGGVSQMTFAATVQMVTVNEISGADTYLKMLRDGMCKQPVLTCTDQRSSVTSGSLTFAPGMATEGFIDMLKPWVGERATTPDYEEGDANNAGGSAVIDKPADNLGLPSMCWGASGGPLLECGVADPSDTITIESTVGGSIKWASDCETKTVAGGKLISSCMASTSASSCADDRRIGVFSTMCYDEVKAFNCAEPPEPATAVDSEAFVEYCTGTMRCLGTECHRPNLSGMHEKSFTEAAGAMEAVNHMKYDMVCAETGEPPTSINQPCTLRVFAGTQMYCAYAVGAGKAMTTVTLVDGNCCRETKEKLGPDVPSWEKYMQAYYITKKLTETEAFKNVVSQTGIQDAYNSIDSYFGEVKDTVTGTFNSAYDQAASFVSQNITKPISSALDGMFGSAGTGTGLEPASTAVDALGKMDTATNYFSSLTNTVSQFKQQMLDVAFEFVKEISPDLATTLFSVDPSTGQATGLSQGVQTAFAVWSMARLVVSIIFACKSIEYEWAMNDKWRLCAYAGTCCGKKVFLLGCIQNRDLYCCYKSIIARVIATEILRKGLVPGRNGYEQRKCTVNCSGFTVEQLGQVDWGRVDLTEAVTAMIDSGILNPNNPQARYGAQGNSLSTSETLGAGKLPSVDTRVAGDKTADTALQNANSLFGFGSTLQGQEQCYNPNDPNKMPFSNPNCDDE